MIIKTLLPLTLLMVLSGCIFRDLSSDYQRAESLEPIEVPNNMASTPMEPLYPIPDVEVEEQAFYDIEKDGFVVPRPEPMSAERENAKIKIQRVGERRWILAEAPTSQVWPLTQSFLSSYGIGVVAREPGVGLVETDWVEFKTDDSTKSQYKLRIEQGLRPATTEVHVLHRQMDIKGPQPDYWPRQSQSEDKESWMLEELANSLAGNIQNKSASLLGQAVGGEVKAKLIVESGEPELQLAVSMERAWATVAHALSKEGFKIWDESSESGIFYVQYAGLKKKKGWFGRLFSADEDTLGERPYSLTEILLHIKETPESKELIGLTPGVVFADPLPNAQGYLVVVRRKGDMAVVKVRNHRGTLLPLNENKHLLGVIRRNLI